MNLVFFNKQSKMDFNVKNPMTGMISSNELFLKNYVSGYDMEIHGKFLDLSIKYR
jgi:hypothetical protein